MRQILVAEDYPEQSDLIAGLLRQARCQPVLIRGCRQHPRPDDCCIDALDMAGRPLRIELASVHGVILDGDLDGCRWHDLLPTFLHHGLFVVGESGLQNQGMVKAGAPMALPKDRVAEALMGMLPPTSCLPWLTAFDEATHRPTLTLFDQKFRPEGASQFGSVRA